MKYSLLEQDRNFTGRHLRHRLARLDKMKRIILVAVLRIGRSRETSFEAIAIIQAELMVAWTRVGVMDMMRWGWILFLLIR